MSNMLMMWLVVAPSFAAGWGQDVWGTAKWGEQDEVCDGLDQNFDGVPDDGDACGCVPGTFLGINYMACREQATYEEADLVCFNMGMTLMELNEPIENSLIMTRLANNWPNKTWWVGGNDISVEGVFEWTTSPMLYTNWYPGQPDNDFGDQNCVGIYPTGGGWFDMNCEREMAFTCEELGNP